MIIKDFKKLIKKIKKNLVRKVIFSNYYFDNDAMYIELGLKNIRSFKKVVRAELHNEGTLKLLKHQIKGNVLIVKIPIEFLAHSTQRKKMKLYINNRKMWINQLETGSDSQWGVVVKDQYLHLRTKKDVIFENLFPEFSFNRKKINVHNLKTHYNYLEFQLEKYMEVKHTIQIFAFNKGKYRVIETKHDTLSHKIKLEDFTFLSAGVWNLFIHIDGRVYPLATQENSNCEFNTFNHKVTMKNTNNMLSLILISNKYRCSFIRLTPQEELVKVEFALKMDAGGPYKLQMQDIRSNSEACYSLAYSDDNKLVATVPKKDLIEGDLSKRFFIVSQGQYPTKYQFDFSDENINTSFEMNENSQLITVKFYKRKDKSLGVKLSVPKLKKMITQVKGDFIISGYVGPLDRFVNCTSHLMIEDRYSMEAINFSVDRNFTVDLSSIDLVDLKSKDKTVLDFFIVIKDRNETIIRKEKIKYKYSNYKKDNYYGRYQAQDAIRDTHHFLITTTPFNNLKLESFKIPKNIILPENPVLKDDNVWLIGERYNTAQDNGIVLFNWLQENTEIDAYYVIESDSIDYDKIKHNQNVLAFGSDKHFEVAFKAKVLLGTHDLENILPYKPAKGYYGYENTFKVFLQHGVLGRKNVEYHKRYYETPFDLFIVSSEQEKYDVVMKQLGYEENEVAVTGLARFDNLIGKKKPKDILLMPTWRDWINTDEQFINSEYYLAYTNLIKNKTLINLLEKHNVNLNFYPHYRAQGYFNKELGIPSDRIKFISQGTKTVQELLISHALLITDYSSVSFDFSLMNKPVIFYHFDVGRFFRRGILRPIEETFIGNIAESEMELVEYIKERLEKGFDNFSLDVSGILKYQDNLNSERIYHNVKNKLQ